MRMHVSAPVPIRAKLTTKKLCSPVLNFLGKPTAFEAGAEVYIQSQSKQGGSTGWIRGTIVAIDANNAQVQLNSQTTMSVPNSDALILRLGSGGFDFTLR